MALPELPNVHLGSGGKSQQGYSTATGGTSSTTQTNTENTNTAQTNQQQQNQNEQRNSWLLNMPGLNALVQRSINEAQALQTPQYQYAGLNAQEQQALNTLMQGRNAQALQSVMGQYVNQANSLTNYGQQQTPYQAANAAANAQNQANAGAYQRFGAQGANYASQQQQINQLAKGYYQSDLVNQQKANLRTEINNQLAGNVNTLNQQAVGTGNMASSRAGIAEGVMRSKANEAIAQGNTQIETNAVNQAYGMATNQYQAGQQQQLAALQGQVGITQSGQALALQNLGAQTNIYQNAQNALQSNLNAQTNLGNALANWQQTDAQTAFNAAQQMQKNTQGQYDIQRQNQLLTNTQAGQALTAYLPSWSALANLGVTTSGTASTTGSANTGVTSTQNSNQQVSQQQQGLQSSAASGENTNWAALGAGLAGQAVGGLIQPVASAAGSAIASAAGNWLSKLF